MFKTLKGKFSGVYLGLILLMAIIGLTSVVNLAVIERSVNALMTRNYRSINSASDMMYALENQDKAVITFLSLDEDAGISDFYAYDKQFQNSYDVDANNVTEQGEQAVIDEIESQYSKFEEMFARIVRLKNEQGINAAKVYYNDEQQPVIENIRQQLQKLIDINQTAMFNSKDEASGNAKVSTYVLLFISLLAVSFGFVMSRYFVNRFLKPISELTEGMSKVNAGELDLKLEIETTDEAGMLAHEFNEMTRRLSVYEKSTMGILVGERNKSVAIVKSIADPLIVLDINYRIVLLNNAGEKFFAISEQSATGRHFLEVIHNGELFDLVSGNALANQSRTEKILQFDGDEHFFYNVVVTRFFDTENNPVGSILLMQNVTALKELELVRANFMSTVSHEFKTPLTSIIMGASMLKDFGDLTGEQADIVKTILEDSDRLTSFVNELLEVSRLEAGKSIFKFVPCSISEITENSCRLFRDYTMVSGISLVTEVSPELPVIKADPEKISWVLNNLISNALKYSKAGDSIKIEAYPEGDMLEITVSDTGEGIPKEYHNRIFDRFFQVKEHELEVRGTGIGLWVAKGIITAHGGSIGVESEPGAGSIFRFTLPLFEKAEGAGDI